MSVHHFDPATSGEHDAHEWWSAWYRRAFADYATHDLITDKKLQKAGIDHRVRLSGGGEVLVDVKCRCTAKSYHDDFLVEVWSDVEGRRPGWARKSAHCHYVAYVWPQYEFGLLIPFTLLRRTYEQNKHAWRDAGLRVVDALNRDYTTRNVAVPLDQFQREVAKSMVVYFAEDMEPFV